MWTPWVEDEYRTLDLKDKRLTRRLGEVVSQLGAQPHISLPQALTGHAELTAAYRLFDNPKATFEALLAPHIDATRRRVATEPCVLVPQDTTELDVTRPASEVAGTGPLDAGARRGVFLHLLHAFTPDGTALGTLGARWWAREESEEPALTRAERDARRKQTPVEEKESWRWIAHWELLEELAPTVPGTDLVGLADSEADIYELLERTLKAPSNLKFIVRAGQDRALQPTADATPEVRRLHARLEPEPVRFMTAVRVRPRKAKVGCTKHRRETTRLEGRLATMEVRARRVPLRAPRRPDRRLKPVQVNAVLVREVGPPAGEDPVEWLLLTSLPIDTDEAVHTVIAWYAKRWGIEVFFRTLKTGCRVEARRFEHVGRFTACLAVYLVIAWRVTYLCQLGRECPEMPCEAVFEPAEWKAVHRFLYDTPLPKTPPPLGEMVRRVAILGGFQPGRNRRAGAETFWRGLTRVYDIACSWKRFGPEARNV